MVREEKRKIMIVDAERDFLDIVKLNLEETGGYDICPVWKTVNFMPQFQRFRPELVIVDMMPRTGGWDILRKLSEAPQGQKIPIMIFSSFSSFKEGVDTLKTFNLQAVEHLSKPIEKSVLLEKLSKIFRS